MSLDALPTELLVAIFRHVSAAEFRKIPSCGLAVCKRWYRILEPLLFEDLTLTAAQFFRISEHSVQASTLFTRHLSIDIRIRKGDDSFLTQELEDPLEHSSIFRFQQLNAWIGKASRLETLKFRLLHDMSPEEVTWNESLDGWKLGLFYKCLWASKLTSVSIDTLGAWIRPNSRQDSCFDITWRLPSLKSVWLRLHKICPDILCFECFDNYKYMRDCPPPKLEKLVITLSMVRDDSDIAVFSRGCTGSIHESEEVHELWFTRAREAVQALPCIKELWLLHHDLDGGNSPDLLAHEFVSNVFRSFGRDEYDKHGFDPTDDQWRYLNAVMETDNESD